MILKSNMIPLHYKPTTFFTLFNMFHHVINNHLIIRKIYLVLIFDFQPYAFQNISSTTNPLFSLKRFYLIHLNIISIESTFNNSITLYVCDYLTSFIYLVFTP